MLGLPMLVLGAAAVLGWFQLVNHSGRTPGELIAYAERRLEGHPRLQWLSAPALLALKTVSGVDEAQAAALFIVPRLPPNPVRVAAAPPVAAATEVIRVGPGRAITRIGVAARLAPAGSVVEIDPGDYLADVAVWERDNVTVRGLGEHVRLIAAGASAEGKGTWVVRARGVVFENIQFIGAQAADGNGAGIRLESGGLTLRRCLFHGNQNGILTSGDPTATLDIEHSEFGYNGAGDGLTHGVYAGGIARLRMVGNYLHHGNVGHLVKSRAVFNRLEHNRLSDEDGGQSSYELEFPNGGVVELVGNILQQGGATRNSVMLSYGVEGLTGPRHELTMVHNSFINLAQGGTFVRTVPGTQRLLSQNNLLAGPGRAFAGVEPTAAGDLRLRLSQLARPTHGDFRPVELPSSYRPAPLDTSWPVDLAYRHPAQRGPIPRGVTWPGALEPAVP